MHKKVIIFISLILVGLMVKAAFSNLVWAPDTGKDEIVIVQKTIPVTLDPAKNSYYGVVLPLTGIYEGLVKLNPETLAPEPCLAERWGVSEGGKRWTFYLRPNILFSDGTPCDADAVKASMERSISLKDSEPYPAFVFAPVSSIVTEGRYTVSFYLKYPFSPFLKNLAMPFASPVVSPSALERYGDRFWMYPSGTGPYTLDQYSSKRLVLRPNPLYRGEPAPAGKIVFESDDNSADRDKKLLNKKADIIFYPSLKNMDRLREKGMKTVSIPGLDISYLGFYTDKTPLNDPELRRAISGLLDRGEIVSDVLDGEGIPATGFLPPVLSATKTARPEKYTPESVKDILSRKGYGGGLSLILITYSDSKEYCPSGGEALAKEIKRELEPAGIRLTIETRPWEEHKEAINKEKGDMFLYGWTGDNGDPDNFLYTLFYSSQVEQGLDTTHFKNQQLDVYLLTARTVTDARARRELYTEAEKIVKSEAPAAALNNSVVSIAYSPLIRQLHCSAFGLIDLSVLEKEQY